MDSGRLRSVASVVGLVVVLMAGAVVLWTARPRPAEPSAPPVETASVVVPADPDVTYDPVEAGKQPPEGYRPLLDRDQIEPVYEPAFTTAGEVDWPGEMLVIGVAGADSAKAYPVTHLNQREMVIDSLEGIPILVTW